MSLNKQIDIIKVSVCGALHKSKNLFCQDFACHKIKGKKLVAVVSDGAGSAKYGRIGARVIAETMCDLLISSDFKNVRQNVEKAVLTARKKLEFHRLNRTKSEHTLADFSATIVGVFYDGGKGIFFHIGDGAGLAFFDEEYQSYKISEPENGAFSCETFFYTMQNWQENLRFCEFENAKFLVLMTDGVSGFVFDDFQNLRNNFLPPIMQYLNTEQRKNYALKALQNTLSSREAMRINGDDKTILWAKLK